MYPYAALVGDETMSDECGPGSGPRPGPRTDSQCFGCAPDNAYGLGLWVEAAGDGRGAAELRPRPEHEGPPGHLHGGLAATALDEAMGWAAHDSADDGWVTATLEVRYRKPVPLDAGSLRVEAETVKRSGRRKRLAARLILADGTVAVEAESVFVKVK